MKKILALALCLMMILCACAAAETAGKQELGKLKVKNAFTIQYGELPEGYTLDDIDEDDLGISALISGPDDVAIVVKITYDDLYSEVERLNDLPEEEMEVIKRTFTDEFDNVEFEIRETAYGTMLLVSTISFDDGSIVGNIFTIYQGYDVELFIFSVGEDPVTEEVLQNMVKFLSDMDFVPAEGASAEQKEQAQSKPASGEQKKEKAQSKRAGSDFTVYGEDATQATIYPAVGGHFLDAKGNTYKLTQDGVYVRNSDKMLFSSDSNYWKDSKGPETKVGDAFTVYGEDATTASIYPVAGGYHMDANGNAYDLTSDGLYCNTDTKMLYSADPNYWGNGQDEDADEDENDRGPETKTGDAFMVFGEDGTKASIYPVAGGYFMDAGGNSYDRTSDGLYCNTDTKMLYSSDSTYWHTSEDEDMGEDEAVDSVEDENAGETVNEGGDAGETASEGGDAGETASEGGDESSSSEEVND